MSGAEYRRAFKLAPELGGFMRVLIACVDVFTIARIKLTLAKEKIMHDTTDLGEDGLHLAKLYDYDIVLYDVTRSEIGGYKMLQRLRNAQVSTPILILSGLGEPRSEGQVSPFRRGRRSDEAVRRRRAIGAHPGNCAPFQRALAIDDPDRQARRQPA